MNMDMQPGESDQDYMRRLLRLSMNPKYEVSAHEVLTLKLYVWESAGQPFRSPSNAEYLSKLMRMTDDYPSLTLEVVYLNDLNGYRRRNFILHASLRLYKGKTQVECLELFERCRDDCRLGIDRRINLNFLEMRGLNPRKMPEDWLDWEMEHFFRWYDEHYLYTRYYEVRDSKGRIHGPWTGAITGLLSDLAPMPLRVEKRCAGDSKWYRASLCPDHRPPKDLVLPSDDEMHRQVYRLIAYLVSERLLSDSRQVVEPVPDWVERFQDFGFVPTSLSGGITEPELDLQLESGEQAELVIQITPTIALLSWDDAMAAFVMQQGHTDPSKSALASTDLSPPPDADQASLLEEFGLRAFPRLLIDESKEKNQYRRERKMLDWIGGCISGERHVLLRYSHEAGMLVFENRRIAGVLEHLRQTLQDTSSSAR